MSGDPCIASTPPLDSYQSLGMLPDPPPASVYPAPAATPLSRAIPAHRASLLSSTSAADRAYQLSTQTPQALHAYPADDLASSTLSALRAWQLAQLTQTPSAHHANPATDMQSSQPLSSDQDRSRMSAASTSMSSLPPVNIDRHVPIIAFERILTICAAHHHCSLDDRHQRNSAALLGLPFPKHALRLLSVEGELSFSSLDFC